MVFGHGSLYKKPQDEVSRLWTAYSCTLKWWPIGRRGQAEARSKQSAGNEKMDQLSNERASVHVESI